MGSYKRQLLSGFALVVIGILAGSFVLYRGTVQETILEQARDTALKQLRTAEYALRQARDTRSEPDVRDMLLELARRSNARLSLINVEGKIIVDTGLQPSRWAKIGSRLGLPEIKEADEEGTGDSIRYSPELHVKFLFVARKIEGLAGMEDGFLRLGKPYAPLLQRMDQVRSWFLVLVAGALLLLVPVYLFLNRRLNREIGRITQEVEAIGRHEGRASYATLREFVPMIRSVNKISEQTRDYLQQLSMQRDEGDAIINGLEAGVAVLDPHGRVRRYNRAMAEIVHSQQDLTGRKPIEFIPSTELQDAVEEMLESQKADSGCSLYVTFYNQSHFEAALLPVVLEQFREMELLLVLHDVTELKRLEQARKDFVANISHELRTPITSIKGYTETLHHSPPKDSETLHSFMNIVSRNVDNLERLVDNLIHLSRAEATEESDATLDEEVDLAQVLEAAWQVCAPIALRRGVELDRELPETESPCILGNKDHLIRALLNLLDNAIKYSPEGGRITVRVRDLAERWQVEVEDDGAGVPPGVQSRIFERFYRGETGRSGNVGGTGLGLSICKHILQRHGGEITVESPIPGDVKGARFAFTLAKHRQRTESSDEERAHE